MGRYLQRHPYAIEVQERVKPRPGIVVPILLPQHFSRLSTTILTFLEPVEPYLQRHPYINIRFWFLSSPYLLQFFSHLCTTILSFLEAGEPNIQRHPYNIRFWFPNATFGSPSSRYPPCDFFPPLYLHFNFSWSGGAETSNVTPTPTSDSDFPPRVTHPRIFSHLSTSILTHHQAVEPSLQRHPYTLPYLHAPIR